MVSIEFLSKRYTLKLNLSYKITVIRGDSGIGKTSFTYMYEHPNKFLYKIKVTEGYKIVPLSERTYSDLLLINDSSIRRVYYVDDEDFIFTVEFAEFIKKDKNNLFVIFNRLENKNIESLGILPIHVNAVLKLVNNGVSHWVEPYYSYDSEYVFNKFDMVLTEDRKSGFSFFKNVFNPDCVLSLDGKDDIANKLIKMLPVLRSKNICLLVDLAAFGSGFESLYTAIKVYKLHVYLNPNYLSFEYMLLRSNMFKFSLDEISFEEKLKYMSLENLCESYIHKVTAGKAYKYTKKYPINGCYVEDCCRMTKSERNCDRSIAGNKIRELFKGTEFEDMIEVLINS